MTFESKPLNASHNSMKAAECDEPMSAITLEFKHFDLIQASTFEIKSLELMQTAKASRFELQPSDLMQAAIEGKHI